MLLSMFSAGQEYFTVPGRISYQGYLSAAGMPYNGTTNFTLRVNDGSADIWMTNLNASVFQGVYSLKLNIPAGIMYPSNTYTFRILVDGSAITPDIEFLSVPYAYYANYVHWSNIQGIPSGFEDGQDDTSNLWNMFGGGVYYNAGSVGIGISAPASRLTVTNTIAIESATAPALTFSEGDTTTRWFQGVDAARMFFSIHDTATSNRVISLTENYVGIFNGTPSYPLDVNGNVNISGNLSISGTVDGYDISSFGPYWVNSAGSSGQVWKSDGSGRGYWGTDNNTQLTENQVENYIMNDISTGYIPYDDGSDFANSGIYNNGGNIGIGTTSGAYKLYVNGTMYVATSITLAANATVDGIDISDYSPYWVYGVGSSGQVWKSDGSGRGYWGTDNNTQLSEDTVETYVMNDISTRYIPYDDGTDFANSTLYYAANGNLQINTTSTSYDDSELNIYGGSAFRGMSTYGSMGSGVSFIATSYDDWGVCGWGGTMYFSRSTDNFASQTDEYIMTSSHFAPWVNGVKNLGISTKKWLQVYAVFGAINTSDRREKKDIRDLDYGLDEVMALKPSRFNWRKYNNKNDIGLIAQDVVDVIPEIVDIGEDQEATMGINYAKLGPVLVKAIQEQQQTIKDLEKRIRQLEEK